MPFLNRRVWLFLLVDAAILLGLAGSFILLKRAFSSGTTQLSQRILTTPGASFEDSDHEKEAASAPSAERVDTASSDADKTTDTGEAESIDLKRLRSKKLTVVVHKVELGENYWSIATDNNVTINTLLGANPDMPFKASIHQSLNIMNRKGVLHTVQKGEKLAQIAAIYKSDEKILKDENGITWWKGLKEGDVLFIPDVKPIHMVKEWRDYFGNRGFFGIPFAGWGKGWTSGFGYRTDPITGETKLHKGMDFKAKWGESVYAAAGGRVIFAGVSGGYGNLIQIRHANGYLTYYGHLSKILTKQGHKVRRGELIGKVGATGRVTGPHLHFEIRKNGKAINPLPLI